jgi:uncharacterized protein (DUF305 family)
MVVAKAARDGRGAMVRRGLGCWVVITVLAAGCATPENASQPPVDDQADILFMQHMVPHLLQDTSIVDLAQDRITRPELARLAEIIGRQGQAHLQQLQGWLNERGLAPYDPQQDADTRKTSDLERLAQVARVKFDLAFLKVMTSRHRAGIRLVSAELRAGTVPRPANWPASFWSSSRPNSSR